MKNIETPQHISELQKLSQEISREFGIQPQNAEMLLKAKTSLSLQEFQKEVSQIGEKNISLKLSPEQSERLYDIVTGYRKLITAKTELGIETLKQSISTERPRFESFGQQIGRKYFPELQKRVQNPKNFSDQISGGFLGVFESSISLLDLCYRIGLGIIKSPYDIYLLITGRAEYKNWKRV